LYKSNEKVKTDRLNGQYSNSSENVSNQNEVVNPIVTLSSNNEAH
jgi:hypothetical protein